MLLSNKTKSFQPNLIWRISCKCGSKRYSASLPALIRSRLPLESCSSQNSRTSLTFALPFLSTRNILALCNYHHFNWSLNTTCCHLIERQNKSAETKPQINNAFSIFTRFVLFTVKRWREKMAFLRGIVTRGGQCHFTKDDFELLCSWEKKVEMLITYSSFPFSVPARLLYFRIIFEDATYWINQSINSPHANT